MKVISLEEYKPDYFKVVIEHRRFFLAKERISVILVTSNTAGWLTINVIMLLRNGFLVDGRKLLQAAAIDAVEEGLKWKEVNNG